MMQVVVRESFADIMRCHPELKEKTMAQIKFMYSPKHSQRKLAGQSAGQSSPSPRGPVPNSLTTAQANRLRRVDTAIRVNQGASLTRKTDSSYDLRQPFSDGNAAGEGNKRVRGRRVSTVSVDRIVPL